ncbi:MAG: type I 3-dehydroquinate dehydratase [Roseimicrobium sp.]
MPLVVGAISTAETLQALATTPELCDPCDVLELRLDAIAQPLEETRAHASALRLPLLMTARHPEEGGQGNLNTQERAALLSAHLEQAALIDVELRSALDMQPLLSNARARGVGIIGSYHDFNATPSDDVLRGAIDFGLQLKADAVKIATLLRSADDLARLLSLLSSEKRLPLSIMGMGALGPVSRLVLGRCGSILNYGYLGQSNAPGQWPAQRLKNLLNEL